MNQIKSECDRNLTLMDFTVSLAEHDSVVATDVPISIKVEEDAEIMSAEETLLPCLLHFCKNGAQT